jgi:hypothetical protein
LEALQQGGQIEIPPELLPQFNELQYLRQTGDKVGPRHSIPQ